MTIATKTKKPKPSSHHERSKPNHGLAHPAKSISIQPKLTIGKPNDKYEQEADRVADKVVSMPAHRRVQKKCSSCAQEEKEEPAQGKFLQRQEEEKEEPAQAKLLQPKKFSPENTSPGNSLERSLSNSKSGGRPLPDDTRSFMESRIGADFSNVKVHTGNNAVKMSKELNAQAFTHDSHIYFNSGKYNPSSTQGKHLLAHELMHTLQQSSTDYQNKGIIHNRANLNKSMYHHSIIQTSGIPDNFVMGKPLDISIDVRKMLKELVKNSADTLAPVIDDILWLKEQVTHLSNYEYWCGEGNDCERGKKKHCDVTCDEIDCCCKKHDEDYDQLGIRKGKLSMWSPFALIQSVETDEEIANCMLHTNQEKIEFNKCAITVEPAISFRLKAVIFFQARAMIGKQLRIIIAAAAGITHSVAQIALFANSLVQKLINKGEKIVRWVVGHVVKIIKGIWSWSR